MKSILYGICICLLCVGCGKSDLTQEQMETWITEHVFSDNRYSTAFDNGYGFTHDAFFTDITVKDIGMLEITDENTRTISVAFSYHEEYYTQNATKPKEKDYDRTLDFVFKRSTDGKWYFSELIPFKSRNKPYKRWKEKIMSTYAKMPIE